MNTNAVDTTFDPQTLAGDLYEVRRLYAQLFAGLAEADWDKPVKGGSQEWTLHETVAHLCALNGAGLASLQHALRGEPYTFIGLEDRYALIAFNRRGIDEHLGLPMTVLCAKLLGILDEAAGLARNLQPGQAELTAQMPIYNRPVTIVEALGIIMTHAGLFHSAQVAEPAGVAPLWEQLSPEIRHRVIGRTMRAFSLLYRQDLGGALRAALVFRIDGPGGGEWFVKLSPEAATSGEGAAERPGLVIHLRDTAVFCRMLTDRINLPVELIRGGMRLRGDLRLFLRMDTLFSVDARPKAAASKGTLHMNSQTYFNQVAPDWDKMRTGFFSDALREKAYAVADVHAGELAADIGAGTGFIAEGLRQKGLRVIAVDQSEAMLAELKKRFADIDCRLGSADRLPIPSATVNHAFANMYLHHVENPPAAIQEMARTVQAGGKVVITDLDEHPFEFLRAEQYDRWLGFKREAVRQWFVDAGLKNVSVDCAGSTCSADSNQGSKHASVTIFVASGEK